MDITLLDILGVEASIFAPETEMEVPEVFFVGADTLVSTPQVVLELAPVFVDNNSVVNDVLVGENTVLPFFVENEMEVFSPIDVLLSLSFGLVGSEAVVSDIDGIDFDLRVYSTITSGTVSVFALDTVDMELSTSDVFGAGLFTDPVVSLSVDADMVDGISSAFDVEVGRGIITSTLDGISSVFDVSIGVEATIDTIDSSIEVYGVVGTSSVLMDIAGENSSVMDITGCASVDADIIRGTSDLFIPVINRTLEVDSFTSIEEVYNTGIYLLVVANDMDGESVVSNAGIDMSLDPFIIVDSTSAEVQSVEMEVGATINNDESVVFDIGPNEMEANPDIIDVSSSVFVPSINFEAFASFVDGDSSVFVPKLNMALGLDANTSTSGVSDIAFVEMDVDVPLVGGGDPFPLLKVCMETSVERVVVEVAPNTVMMEMSLEPDTFVTSEVVNDIEMVSVSVSLLSTVGGEELVFMPRVYGEVEITNSMVSESNAFDPLVVFEVNVDNIIVSSDVFSPTVDTSLSVELIESESDVFVSSAYVEAVVELAGSGADVYGPMFVRTIEQVKLPPTGDNSTLPFGAQFVYMEVNAGFVDNDMVVNEVTTGDVYLDSFISGEIHVYTLKMFKLPIYENVPITTEGLESTALSSNFTSSAAIKYILDGTRDNYTLIDNNYVVFDVTNISKNRLVFTLYELSGLPVASYSISYSGEETLTQLVNAKDVLGVKLGTLSTDPFYPTEGYTNISSRIQPGYLT